MMRAALGKAKLSWTRSYEKDERGQETQSRRDCCADHPNRVARGKRYRAKSNRRRKGSPRLDLDSFRSRPLPATTTYNLRYGAHAFYRQFFNETSARKLKTASPTCNPFNAIAVKYLERRFRTSERPPRMCSFG